MAPSSPTHRRVRILAAALLVALAASFVLATSALAGAITPESGGSPNADRIASLYKIVLYVAIVVFLAVEGGLVYALFRFRARKGRVAAQIRGNTSLEIGWTVGAALILVVVAVFTFARLPSINNPERSGAGGLNAGTALYASVDQPSPPGGKQLKVCVNGQQYIWRFTYTPNCNDSTGKAYAYDTMVVPVDTTVTLDIAAQDVAHSWWIPKLGGKFDAVPGYTNHTWFKISTPGVYYGQCAELCGRNHANMIARVKAVPVAEYQSWVQRQKQEIDAANKAATAARQTQSPIPTGPNG